MKEFDETEVTKESVNHSRKRLLTHIPMMIC